MFSQCLLTPTVPPVQIEAPGPEISSHVITVLVISPVVLLAAVLPCVIWSLMKTKSMESKSRNTLLLRINFTYHT